MPTWAIISQGVIQVLLVTSSPQHHLGICKVEREPDGSAGEFARGVFEVSPLVNMSPVRDIM
jgi:hypothetical protein